MDRVVIKCDGTLHSDLAWVEESELAEEAKGPILWHLDLGLFDRMKCPLDHEPQCRSFGLAVEHFCNTLWKKYRKKSVGLCLYRGSLDFTKDFPWDERQKDDFREWVKREFGADVAGGISTLLVEQLFCRNAATSYLDILTSYTPFDLEAVLILDAHTIKDPIDYGLLVTPEKYEAFSVEFVNPPVSSSTDIPTAICIPPVGYQSVEQLAPLRSVVADYTSQGKPYRLISEYNLLNEWEGVDTLVVSKRGLSNLGERKLAGFIATGGEVVYV